MRIDVLNGRAGGLLTILFALCLCTIVAAPSPALAQDDTPEAPAFERIPFAEFQALQTRAEDLLEDGREDEALQLWQDAAAEHPRAIFVQEEHLLWRAHVLGDEEADRWARERTRDNPDEPFAWFLRGWWEDEVAHLRQALSLDENFWPAAIAIGDLYWSDSPNDTIQWYRHAAGLAPDEGWPAWEVANWTHQHLGVEEALPLWADAAAAADAEDERRYGITRSHADALAELGRGDEALTALEQAVGEHPEVARLHGDLGDMLAARGLWDRAVAHYRRWRDLAPADDTLWTTDLAAALLATGAHEEARPHVEDLGEDAGWTLNAAVEAMAGGRLTAEAWRAWWGYLQEPQGTEREWQLIDEAVTLAPQFAPALDEIRPFLVQREQWQRLVDVTGRLAELQPENTNAAWDRGVALLALERPADAVAILEAAITAGANDTSTRVLLAAAQSARDGRVPVEAAGLYARGLAANDVDLHNRAIELAPDWLEPRVELAVAMTDTEDWMGARALLAEGLEGHGSDVARGLAYYNLAHIAQVRGRWQDGLRHVRAAIAADDSDPDYWHLRTQFLIEAGRPDEAWHSAQEAWERHPASVEADWSNAGVGRLPEAETDGSTQMLSNLPAGTEIRYEFSDTIISSLVGGRTLQRVTIEAEAHITVLQERADDAMWEVEVVFSGTMDGRPIPENPVRLTVSALQGIVTLHGGEGAGLHPAQARFLQQWSQLLAGGPPGPMQAGTAYQVSSETDVALALIRVGEEESVAATAGILRAPLGNSVLELDHTGRITWDETEDVVLAYTMNLEGTGSPDGVNQVHVVRDVEIERTELVRGDPAPSSGVLIEGIHYVKQVGPKCAAASLNMILGYWGDTDLDQEKIYDEINIGGRGAPAMKIFEFPRDRGYRTYPYRSNLEDLKAKLRAGVPMLLFTTPQGMGHALVAVGYDDARGEIILNDPTVAEHVRIPYDAFDAEWAQSDRVGLAIVPDPLPDDLRDLTFPEGGAVEHKYRGDQAADDDQWEQAAGLYREALDQAPDYREARQALVRMLLALDRDDDALAEVEHMLDADADDLDALVLKAQILTDDDRFDEALEVLDGAMADAPGNLWLMLVRGGVLGAAERWDEALDQYRDVIGVNPYVTQGHYGVIGALQELGRWDEALQQARRIHELEPYDPVGRQAIAGVHTARASDEDLDLPWAEQERLYREALAELRKISTIDVLDGGWYSQVAGIHEWFGNIEEAIRLLERGLENVEDEDEGLYNNLAWYHTILGRNLERSRELAEKSVDIDAEAYNLDTLAWVEFKLGNLERAEELQVEARRRRDGFIYEAHLVLIRRAIALEAGTPREEADAEARELLEAALAADEDDFDDDPEDFNRHLELARALREVGWNDWSLEIYEEAADGPSEARKARLEWARALLDDGVDVDEAIEILEGERDHDPTHVHVRSTLGRAYMAAGRTDDAVAELEAVVDVDSPLVADEVLAPARARLGLVMHERGTDGWRPLLETALPALPHDGPQADLRERVRAALGE